MAFERWGSLSVDDHVDTPSLLANVLLYDRLVVPVMTAQADRDEEAYWTERGWAPKLQAERIRQLGDLAIRRPWDAGRRAAFSSRAAELAAEQADAQVVDSKRITRRILAQEQVTEKLPGVQHVQVIAAYNSAAGFGEDVRLTTPDDALSAQALLLSRRLAVPRTGDPEYALAEAIGLSRDREFREKRAELFDWQERTLMKGATPEATVELIAEMVEGYNRKVEDAYGEVDWKLVLMLSGIGLGFATGGVGAAVAAAAISVVNFVMFDRKPPVDAGSTRPVAMFHDIEARVGARLGAPGGG